MKHLDSEQDICPNEYSQTNVIAAVKDENPKAIGSTLYLEVNVCVALL